jgi:hypothetical protein
MEVCPAVMHRLQSAFRIVLAPAAVAASEGRAATSTLGSKAEVSGTQIHTTTYLETKTHTLRQTEIRAAQLAEDASGVAARLRLSLS